MLHLNEVLGETADCGWFILIINHFKYRYRLAFKAADRGQRIGHGTEPSGEVKRMELAEETALNLAHSDPGVAKEIGIP